MKTFTINDIKYTVQPCTAICMADQADESNRQKALLVSNEANGEKFDFVVFGYDMPETDEDFLCMSNDPGAWESDWEVLEAVKA